MDTLDNGMISTRGGMKSDSMGFHHATQNDMQFKTYELFISGIFCLIFLALGWPQVTETAESKTAYKGEHCTYFTGLV